MIYHWAVRSAAVYQGHHPLMSMLDIVGLQMVTQLPSDMPGPLPRQFSYLHPSGTGSPPPTPTSKSANCSKNMPQSYPLYCCGTVFGNFLGHLSTSARWTAVGGMGRVN